METVCGNDVLMETACGNDVFTVRYQGRCVGSTSRRRVRMCGDVCLRIVLRHNSAVWPQSRFPFQSRQRKNTQSLKDSGNYDSFDLNIQKPKIHHWRKHTTTIQGYHY